MASNGSNPATFTADGLYLPGFRPNSLIGFGVRLMGMVVFVSFSVHAKSVYSNIFSVFTKVFRIKNRDAFRHPLLMSCYRSRFAGGSRMASRFNVGFGGIFASPSKPSMGSGVSRLIG